MQSLLPHRNLSHVDFVFQRKPEMKVSGEKNPTSTCGRNGELESLMPAVTGMKNSAWMLIPIDNFADVHDLRFTLEDIGWKDCDLPTYSTTG